MARGLEYEAIWVSFGSILGPACGRHLYGIFHNETKQLRLYLNQVKYESREWVTYNKMPIFQGMRQDMNPDQSQRDKDILKS